MIAWHHQFTVNLIANHFYTILQADIVHLHQLGLSPHTSCGVMRIAKQENGSLLIGTLGLKVLPVHLKGIAYALQCGFKHLAAVVTDRREETIVIGRQNQHFFTWHSEGLDSHTHGRNNTCGIEYFFAMDCPIVATLEP